MANTGVTKSSARATRASSQPQGGMGPQEISDLVNNQLQPLKETITKDLEYLFKNDINEYKTKIIEVLGIFVALFTFVSVDIQVFKTDISTLSAMGFSVIMLGALLLFVIVLVSIVSEKKTGTLLNSLAGISVALIIVGVIAVGYDHKFTKQMFYTKEETEQIINKKLNSIPPPSDYGFESFKTCLRNGGWNTCLK